MHPQNKYKSYLERRPDFKASFNDGIDSNNLIIKHKYTKHESMNNLFSDEGGSMGSSV